MSENDFKNLYKKILIDPPIYSGALIKGNVIDINNNFVTINSFLKSDCYIPITQFENEKGELEIKIGSEVELVIDIVEDLCGDIRLSREKAKRIRAWEQLENVYKSDKIIIGSVIAKVKGGFTVKLETIKAFLPGSLVSFRSALESNDIKGKELKFKIIKLEKKKNNIVVSQKFMLEEENGENIQNLLGNLNEGNIIKGVIKNITDYGVFIDLGGIDGLLHITDMAWKRIKHPSDLVKIGNEIDVKVLKFDKSTNRVSLGLKQLTNDPWDAIRTKYKEGVSVNGVVTNITDYGCFVEIEEGIEGLVHLSEMDWTNKNVNPKKIVKQGMTVKIIILDINTKKRRISLGLKQNTINPWISFNKNSNIGDKIKGRIKSVTDFGVFLELSNGVDGLVHVSDISWNKIDNNFLRRFKKNKIVDSVILCIDVDRERISLGMKHLFSDPFTSYITNNKIGDIVNCKAEKIINNKLFVKLTDNINGFVISDDISYLQSALKSKNAFKFKAKINKIHIEDKYIILNKINKYDQPKTLDSPKIIKAPDPKLTLGDLLKERI